MAYGLVIRLFRRYFEKRTGRDGVPAVRVGILVSTMSTTLSRMNCTASSWSSPRPGQPGSRADR
jgi:hypothetical protein